MNQISAALMEVLLSESPDIAWVAELDHPTQGTIRMSREGVVSKTLDVYERWLFSFGELNLSLSGLNGSMEAPTFSLVIDDTGGRWTRKFGNRFKGYAVRCKLMSKLVDPADFFTFFSGVVDSRNKTGNRVTLNLRMQDDLFNKKIPTAKIKQSVFTSLPSDSANVGKAIPYLRGAHDSTGLAANGMLPGIYVGVVATKYRYVVSLGWWAQVGRVFVDGVEKVEGTDYSVVQSLTGDLRKATLLDFEVDQEKKTVLVDVREEEDRAPAASLLRLMSDLGWSDYYSEEPDTSVAAIDASSVSAFDDLVRTRWGYSASFYLSMEAQTVADVLKKFLTSFDGYAYWRHDGKLVILPWHLTAQNDQVYMGFGAPDNTLKSRRVLTRFDMLSEPDFPQDPEAEVTTVNGKSGLRGSDNSWLNMRSVVLSRDELINRVKDIQLPWLPATAESVGNIKYLYPDGSYASSSELTAVGLTNVWEVLAQGPPPAARTPGVYAITAKPPTNPSGTWSFNDLPEAVAIAQLALWVNLTVNQAVDGDDDVLSVGFRIDSGGTPHVTVINTSIGGMRAAGVYSLNPDDSLAWTRSAINKVHGYVDWQPPSSNANKRLRFYQLFGIVNYTAAANVNPALLAVLSRLANRYRQAPQQMVVDAKIMWLDALPGDDIPVELPEVGWGGKPWSRGYTRVVGMTIRPGAQNPVTLVLEDIKEQLTTFWIWGKALAGIDTTSAMGDGMAMITNGAVISVTRDSVKYLDSPAGINIQNAGPVVKILANTWPSERNGTLIERSTVQGFARSSFKSGATGLTESAGSGTIEYDTTEGEQLFDKASEVTKHLKITAGDPHSTETYLAWDAVISAPYGGTISIDHKSDSDVTGDGVSWRATRSSDGYYWNDTSGAFQVGSVVNAVTPSLTWDTFRSKFISALGKGGTLSFRVYVPSGGTGGRVVRVGHVHFHSDIKWAGSRFVTDGAAATRSADQITITNDCGSTKTWPNTRGGCLWRVASLWSSADQSGGTFVLMQLNYDSNNGWLLQYVVGTGWQFRAKAAGTSYTCTVDLPVARGTEYKLHMRWTSSLGEWGKALTLSLVVKDEDDVVLGSAETTYVKPTEASSATINLYDSSAPTASQFDGYLIEVRQTPFPPSDVEMGLATNDVQYGDPDDKATE